jgi:lipopolysaccharide cholinephosphotransferase
MKELSIEENQSASFQVLKKLKEVFLEHGWKFYLTYGTLIGAIRHNGFIPWDDDIDVWVPRKDYEAFIEYYKNNSSKFLNYTLFHYSTSKEYIYPIARFSCNEYKTIFDNQKDYGLGVFVDIYPLDGFNPNDKKFIKSLSWQRRIIGYGTFKSFPKSKNILKNIAKWPFYFYAQHSNQTKRLEKISKFSQKYTFENSKLFTCVCWEFTLFYDKKTISAPIYHVFNGEEFLIPNGYDEILTIGYGDYMALPPVVERIGHHFYHTYRIDN